MKNLCARVKDIHRLSRDRLFLCAIVRFIQVFSVVFLVFVHNAFSYPNNRPTSQAVNSDMQSCAPMWTAIGGCVLAYKSGGSPVARAAACATAVGLYNASRAIQDSAANDFKTGSYVANHQDLNGDGLNDYSVTRPQNCADLVGKTIPKVLVDTAGAVHRIWSVGDPPQIQYSAGGSVSNNVPVTMSFLIQQYSPAIVKTLPGCSTNANNQITGSTNELFDPSKYVDNNNTSIRCNGVRVAYDGGEECILQDQCANVGASQKLVCAYEVDDMICAEGVYCSMNIIALNFGAEGILGVIESAFGVNFSSIDARVGDGVDSYSDSASGEVIECKDLCDVNGSYKINYKGPDINGSPIDRNAGDGTCFSDLACSVCYNETGCIDQTIAKKIAGCDPKSLPLHQGSPPPPQGYTMQEVCGYVFNPKYLAHCVPKPYESYQGNYPFPKVISPHCTGTAKVRSDVNEDIRSFSGRAVRCIEQTIKNVFYGTYNIVGDYINPTNNVIIQDQVVGIGCLSDVVTYTVINDPSECSPPGLVSNVQGELRCNTVSGLNSPVAHPSDCGDGMIVKFQNFASDIVTTVLVLAVVLIGILVTFGLFDSMQTALKYVVVFGVVLYFVHGDAWKDGYFDFLMDGGTELGTMVFNALDFGTVGEYGMSFELPDNIACNTDGIYGPRNIIYPEDTIGATTINFESKHKVWDMFDCRMFAFFISGDALDSLGNTVAVSSFSDVFHTSLFSILAFIPLFIIIGPITILLFVFVLLKSLFLIASTMIVIMLLVFVSPLVIPLVLFTNKKARGIFDKWLNQLFGYSMVPLILLVVLGIFFRVLDSSIYGTSSGDVFTVNQAQEVVLDTECNEIFMPCFLYKMGSGKYDTPMTLPLAWLTRDGLMAFFYAALRLLFVFAVMFAVFNFITKSLIQGLLGVTVMEDNVVGAVTKGLKRAGGLAIQGAVKAKGAAGKLANAARGRNNNDYGTK